MSTLIDKPTKAIHRKGRIYVSMANGLDFSFPIQGNPRLDSFLVQWDRTAPLAPKESRAHSRPLLQIIGAAALMPARRHCNK